MKRRKIKMLFTSDWHLNDSSLLDSKIGNKLFDLKLKAINSIRRHAHKTGVTDFFILGDIFHKPDPSSRMRLMFWEFVDSLLENKDITLHIVVGNHDSHGEFGSGVMDEMKLLADSKMLRQINIYKCFSSIDIGETKILIAPWGAEKTQYFEPTMRADILLGHFSIGGFKMSDGYVYHDKEINSQKIRKLQFNHCIMGHLHIPQDYKNMHYCGSPYPITFNEAGLERKRFITYDPSDDGIGSVEIPDDCTFRLASIDLDKCEQIPNIESYVNSIVHLLYTDRTSDSKLETYFDYFRVDSNVLYTEVIKKSEQVAVSPVSMELNENNVMSGLAEYVREAYKSKTLVNKAKNILRRAESDFSEMSKDT